MRRLFLLSSLALLVLSASATPPDTTDWFGSVRYGYDALSDERPAWQRVGLTVQRQFGGGSVVATAGRAERFDRWDEQLGLALWGDLWQDAYGTIQVSGTPDASFSPEIEGYAEAYQVFGAGWEAAGSYRMRRYAEETIHFAGLALARYVERWYLRTKTTLLPREGELGVTQSVMARRYWEAPHAYVSLRASAGRGVEVIESGPEVVLTRSWGLSASVQRFLSEHVGVQLEAHYNDADFFRYTGVSGGVMARW